MQHFGTLHAFIRKQVFIQIVVCQRHQSALGVGKVGHDLGVKTENKPLLQQAVLLAAAVVRYKFGQ